MKRKWALIRWNSFPPKTAVIWTTCYKFLFVSITYRETTEQLRCSCQERQMRQWLPFLGNRSKQVLEDQCRKDTSCWQTHGLKECRVSLELWQQFDSGCTASMCFSKFIKITQANSCWCPHVSSVSNSALTHWEGDPICLYCGTGSVHDFGGRPWCGIHLPSACRKCNLGCVCRSGGKMHHLDIIVTPLTGWSRSSNQEHLKYRRQKNLTIRLGSFVHHGGQPLQPDPER